MLCPESFPYSFNPVVLVSYYKVTGTSSCLQPARLSETSRKRYIKTERNLQSCLRLLNVFFIEEEQSKDHSECRDIITGNMLCRAVNHFIQMQLVTAFAGLFLPPLVGDPEVKKRLLTSSGEEKTKNTIQILCSTIFIKPSKPESFSGHHDVLKVKKLFIPQLYLLTMY